MTLGCFERALLLSDDDNMADIWYNLGQLSIGIGDINLAYQAFRIATSINPKHAESFNNLGVLEMRKGNLNAAKSNFQTASQFASHLHDSVFNQGLK